MFLLHTIKNFFKLIIGKNSLDMFLRLHVFKDSIESLWLFIDIGHVQLCRLTSAQCQTRPQSHRSENMF